MTSSSPSSSASMPDIMLESTPDTMPDGCRLCAVRRSGGGNKTAATTATTAIEDTKISHQITTPTRTTKRQKHSQQRKATKISGKHALTGEGTALARRERTSARTTGCWEKEKTNHGGGIHAKGGWLQRDKTRSETTCAARADHDLPRGETERNFSPHDKTASEIRKDRM